MIPNFLAPYSKLVVAVIGFAILIGLRATLTDYPDLNGLLFDITRDSLVGGLASIGVYQVTNKK